MKFDIKGFAFKETDPETAAAGVFSGYASTWEKDLYGDVVIRGAFADTLANDYPDGGAKIPIHWQHKDGSPNDIIGETISAVEDDKGLLITARLDLDIPEGQRAYDLLKRGLIHQMSIGYIPEETAWIDTNTDGADWDGYREIRKLKLFEISLVQVAANQGAEIVEIKSGRAISKANEDKIRTAYDALGTARAALGEMLDAITDTPDGDGQGDEKDFDPKWAKEFKEISDFFSLA